MPGGGLTFSGTRANVCVGRKLLEFATLAERSFRRSEETFRERTARPRRTLTMIVQILRDDMPESPRDEDCNFGTMACWHRRANLGDVQISDAQEYVDELPEGSLVLGLWLYEHSGMTIQAGDANPFSCGWDSGLVGIIHVSPERIAEVFGDAPDARERARKAMVAEVETYDAWMNGNVYGFRILEEQPACKCCNHTPEPEEVDSCWGFYDLESMKDHVDPELHDSLEKAWNGGML